METNARRRLPLRSNFGWTLLGSVVENAAKWVMFVALTKLVSSEVVGEFALALAIATPITILTQLQLRVVLITDAADEHAFGAYHAVRLLSVAASVAITAVVALGLYGVAHMTALVVLISLSQAAQSVRDIWHGLAQKYERMDVTANASTIGGLASLALFGVALLATRDILAATCGITCAHALTWALYDRPCVRRVVGADFSTAPRWSDDAIRKLFWVSLPLGFTTALVSLNSNVPRYLIEHFLDKKSVGYYASIAYFVLAARLVIGALSRAASPRLAILFRDDRPAYRRLLVQLLAIGAVLGPLGVLCAWLVGEPVLRLVYSDEYAQYSHILVILLVASSVGYFSSFLGVAVSAARLFSVQPVVYVVVGGTTFVGGWLMIPDLGLDGAAWAAVVTNVVAAAINAGLVVHVYRRGPATPGPG